MDIPEEVWDRVMDVNLKGMYLCCKQVMPHLIRQGSGVVLNVSSIASIMATGAVAYKSSKAAVNALTQGLAIEAAPHGVRVNAIAPGFFPTDIATGVTDEVRADLILPRNALPETARNEWIRGAVCFLASDDAAFITGETLVIDGGYLAY